MTHHRPVLLDEVVSYLDLHSGEYAVDCTFGGGGHTQALLKAVAPNGKVLALDADQRVEAINKNFELVENLIFVHSNFRHLKEVVAENFPYPIHGVLIDLGLSSDQLEISGRGFSFLGDQPLDMRFDVDQDITAAGILNNYSADELQQIFQDHGQYRASKTLAQAIVKMRKDKKFRTTQDLVDLVLDIHPIKKSHYKIHPATQVFQALRIEVNTELESLRSVLSQIVDVLAPGGKVAIISFHSLEDHIVKHFFKNQAKENILNILTKKPIVATEAELATNLRSRSAKLRVAQKI